jgi:predicted  nucleic acid-binding Zn-ribbon protein
MTVQMGELLGKRAEWVRERLLESGRDAIVGELAEVAAYDRAVAVIGEAGEALEECQAELAEVIAGKKAGGEHVRALEDSVPVLRVKRDQARRTLQWIETGEIEGNVTRARADFTAVEDAVSAEERELSNARLAVGVMGSTIVELQQRAGRLEKLLPVLAQVEEPAALALRAALAMVA